MSCDLGDQCQYLSAKFSTTGSYYIEECLGPGIPRYTLRSAARRDDDDEPGNSNAVL